MAAKSNGRIFRREKGIALNLRESQDVVSDEIALRDEIFELKRQVMFLKRTNEQNLIKFRKYEDEAKRKDRQIEQLMDPRKNSDIAKILSTKGAAILMNLKDQNNSLIQMILTKDAQIRRLLAEIKTSKLYGGSRKSENHRAEVIRLRNLLIKSQEILKENIDLQQKRQTSIYLNENSVLDESPESGRSSPRELEELRFTVQSLETHIKYSNELIAKKNQEIINLTEELKTLKSSTLCKSCGSFFGSIQYDYQHVHSRRFSTSDQWQENLICRTNDNEKTSEPSEKTCQVGDGTNSNLVPGEFIKFCPYDYSPRKETLVSPESDNETESEKTVQRDDKNSKVEEVDSGHEEKSSQTSEGIISSPRESRPDNTSVGIVSQEKIFSSKKAREKWRNALTKCKQNKKQFSKRNTTNGQDQRARKKIRNRELNKKFESPSENSDLEIHDIEMMEKEFQNSKIFRENDFKELNYSTKNGEAEAERDHEKNEILMEPEENSREKLENDHFSPIKIECEEKESSGVAHDAGSSTSNFHEKNLDLTEHDLGNDSDLREKGDETDKENLENGEKEKIKDDHSTTENSTPGCENLMKINDKSSTESSSCTDTRKIKTEISEMVSDFPPEIQKELQNLYDNITTYEEVEAKKSKAPFARRRSFDSSFDSENDYALGRQPQLVQVEVEINSAPAKVDSENSENIFADDSEGVGGNSVQNSETSDSDDDDVIVR